LKIKEKETRLTLQEHDDDDDDETGKQTQTRNHHPPSLTSPQSHAAIYGNCCSSLAMEYINFAL
jgi:hypothetical protein